MREIIQLAKFNNERLAFIQWAVIICELFTFIARVDARSTKTDKHLALTKKFNILKIIANLFFGGFVPIFCFVGQKITSAQPLGIPDI